MKTDWQRQMDDTLAGAHEKRLLLHCCCAPCAGWCITSVEQRIKTTLFYYNPNIMPRAEYDKRRGELVKLVDAAGFNVGGIIEGEYDNDFFLSLAKGLEGEREGGERCRRCIAMRLEETARRAAEGGFDYFATTLTVSPHKDAEYINGAGAILAEKYGVGYLPSDFKKKEGFKHTVELCRKYDIYRQNYCGCAFGGNAPDMTE